MILPIVFAVGNEEFSEDVVHFILFVYQPDPDFCVFLRVDKYADLFFPVVSGFHKFYCAVFFKLEVEQDKAGLFRTF